LASARSRSAPMARALPGRRILAACETRRFDSSSFVSRRRHGPHVPVSSRTAQKSKTKQGITRKQNQRQFVVWNSKMRPRPSLKEARIASGRRQ
jgi:hypothetical protein